MNKLFLSVVIVALTITGVAADGTTTNRVQKQRRGRSGKPSAGLVEKHYKGKVFRVWNAQTDFASTEIASLTKEMRYTSLLPIECIDAPLPFGKNPFDAAQVLVNQTGVGAGAIIVKDPKLPILLISPDGRWGILNIQSIDADSPSRDKYVERFKKLYWNVVGRTLGAGNSSYPGCVFMPFSNMRRLDSITPTEPCPEPFNKMIETAAVNGIGVLTIAMYKKACEEGWAPAPTNDVQKAIWNKVHTLPKNPMKIEFDPKKGK